MKPSVLTFVGVSNLHSLLSPYNEVNVRVP